MNLLNLHKLFNLTIIDPKYKRQFRIQYNKESVPYLKFITALVLIFLVPFYWLDYVSCPYNKQIIWILRTSFMTIPAILVFILADKKFYLKHYQLYTSIFVILGIISVETMLLVSNGKELCYHTYFLGILVYASLSLPSRLRLKSAVLVYLITLSIFIIVLIFKQNLVNNPALFFNRILLFFSLLTSLAIGHLFIENSNINNFLNQIKVIESNHELHQQNLIIEKHKADLTHKNLLLNEQKKAAETLFKKTKQSITYAQKIQFALLPKKSFLKEYFQDSFVYFSPKEIVSGDFYFWKKINNKIFFALADSTGHGVPGAFMSVLITELLHEALNKNSEPSKILEYLRQNVIFSLKQNKEQILSDGCDISLFVYSPDTHKLEFSGANMSAYLISRFKHELPIVSEKNDYKIYKFTASRQPISYYHTMKDFKNYTTTIHKNDKLLLFTDGITDQFNEKYRKLTFKRFINFVANYCELAPSEFGKKFSEFFNSWKLNTAQTDDASLILLQL